MTAFTINSETCKRDGICVEECPAKVIQMRSKDEPPTPVDDFDTLCLRCGHCVAVCPHGSFTLSWLKPDECLPMNRELAVREEQAEQLLRARRSIRTFKEQPLDRRTLERLLEIGGYAASAKNEQPWHWLVIENSQEVQRLVGMVVDSASRARRSFSAAPG